MKVKTSISIDNEIWMELKNLALQRGIGLNRVFPAFLDLLSDYLSHMANLSIPHQRTKGVRNSKIMDKVVNSNHRFVSF